MGIFLGILGIICFISGLFLFDDIKLDLTTTENIFRLILICIGTILIFLGTILFNNSITENTYDIYKIEKFESNSGDALERVWLEKEDHTYFYIIMTEEQVNYYNIDGTTTFKSKDFKDFLSFEQN